MRTPMSALRSVHPAKGFSSGNHSAFAGVFVSVSRAADMSFVEDGASRSTPNTRLIVARNASASLCAFSCSGVRSERSTACGLFV